VITELFLPTKGGTAVWFDEVYRRLGGKGIHIVTSDVPGAAAHDRHHPNSVHRVDLRRVSWIRPESLWMYVKLLAVAFKLALRYRFDSVHAGRVLPEGLVAWLVARIRGLPCTIYAHGEEITTWRQPAKFRVMRFVYRHVDRVIANSDFTRDELLKLGVAPGRITVIHPGVDLQRFCPGLVTADLRTRLRISEDHKLILCVGRLSRRKGFDQVIRSIPWLVARGLDVHCVIIGLGEDRNYLHELARKLDVTHRVHLVGHVDSNELPRWFNAADVFAMPNRAIEGDTEGFGIVFLEAAACGKPVVAGLDGGTGAAVIDNETGLRVAGADLSAVSNALERLLRDDAFAHTVGDAALSRARESFGWNRVAEATMRLHSSDNTQRARGTCAGRSS
jgi:phosphatidylinositol alpha-1,6-mannosyltransferase